VSSTRFSLKRRAAVATSSSVLSGWGSRAGTPRPMRTSRSSRAWRQRLPMCGLAATRVATTVADVADPEQVDAMMRAVLERFDRIGVFRAIGQGVELSWIGTPGRDRLRMMNLIPELEAGEFGDYPAAHAIHAEGSIEAEKSTVRRAYDPPPSRDYVRRLAGMDP